MAKKSEKAHFPLSFRSGTEKDAAHAVPTDKGVNGNAELAEKSQPDFSGFPQDGRILYEKHVRADKEMVIEHHSRRKSL